MADPISIDQLPVIQPTPEEKAAYERQFGPPPLNPIRDLTAAELADLASADKENFELVSAFRQNKDLWADPAIVQKVADANNLIRQKGFSLSDLPSPGKALGMAWDVAKGFGKQLWNYGSAAVETGMGIAADITGQEGIARELGQQAQRRVAENIAGTEQALFGLAEMGERTAGKLGRATGLAQPLAQQTPEQKVADLWKAVGVGETQEDIARGKGGFLEPVGGEVIRELEQAGKPIRPEETAVTAAGDPFSFYLFGKGFGAAGTAARAVVPAGARVAVAKVAEAGAEKVAGAVTQAAGKTIQTGGKAIEIAGKAAPVTAAAGALASGQPVTALAILGGGRTAGRTVEAIGRRVAEAGKNLAATGREVSGAPITRATAQGIRDIAAATPGALGEIGIGTGADIGLAAVSAETPQQTEGAVGIGTVFGALGAARRVGGRVVSGQLIAPREYGVANPVPSSGSFPAFDVMHANAFNAAPPGVKARLNAVREFARSAGLNTDIFMAQDAPTLEKALTDAGMNPATAKQFSEQEGFFTTSLPDANGQPRKVIIAKNVQAAPHEAFHALQDVLGEPANRAIDELVRQEYAPRWDAEGQRYAQRLVGDLGQRAWEEVILDESGWGLDAAKEKIYDSVYNRLEAETGAAPTEAQVRDLADPELVRIFNEAQSRNPQANPSQFWREVLSPSEAKAEADRYIARELAAENFDAVFKNLGAKLQPGSFSQKLARIVGNVVSTLGGEPLAGRQTEIGRVEPRFKVTQKVAEIAQGRLPETPVQPSAVPPPRPGPRGGPPVSPEGRQDAVDEARKIAEEAPDVPTERGTKSPRELLGQMAEAIAQQAGVKINYLSAPDEPAAATTSNRAQRRAMIEAFRTMPAAARSLWEKSFFPERVLKNKSGYQVMGWAPEVFAANAHKLAQTLSDIPTGQELVPYELDASKRTFSEAGWKQLYEDAQQFVQNQMAGATGAGQPLVVPRGVTEQGFFAPPTTPSRTGGLEQGRADVINMLFNFRLPDQPRITRGRLPLNVAGQEVSIATTGGPQRLSVPVEARQPFTGEAAQQLGIEGRSILEVNPVRGAIEAAASRAKVAMPEFIEAIQRLNLENIKEVELATELPQFRGNTLTLSAGFQPKSDPRAVKAAAVRDERGRVFEGAWHGEAMDRAFAEGASRDVDLDMGFVTNSGEYLNREQALARAEELKQVKSEEIRREAFGEQGVLEAEEFKALRQFQPAPETIQRVIDMPAEEWRAFTKDFKGRFGSGLTGFAYELGSNAKTPDQALALKSASEQLRELARQIPVSIENFDQRASLIARAQAFREAYEAATGEGSAVDGIRKFYDPNYTPPVQAKGDSGVAKAVLAAHEVDGGSTFSLSQNKNLAGEPMFAVSTNPERSKIIDGAPTERDLADYIKANQDLLAQPDKSMGTWTNQGKTYLDVVSTIPDRDAAIKLGRDNDQIAIFDLKNRKEIPTGGTGKIPARFQPKAEGELPGLQEPEKPAKKEALPAARVAEMSQEQLREYYPEALVPNRRTQQIPSDIINSPLAKSTDNPEQAFADKLVEFARSVEQNPEYQMGRKWYSEFTEQLKSRFGDDARIFAELLAATSPQTSVGVNYKFALDALEGFKTGRFKPLVKKYEQGLQMIADNKWRPWYDAEVKAGRVPKPPAKPGPGTFIEHWIARHNLKPRQANGALFGINSVPVLQVMARRWLESNKGPKVKNFVENLLGESHEATIDVWADRTLRRLGYEGFTGRWRILPLNKSGVTDADFNFAQAIFRNAAKQLGMKADELQAAVWFAEKQHWADNGWVRLDLGDFREEMKKTEKLRADIRSKTTPPQEPLEFEELTQQAESATL